MLRLNSDYLEGAHPRILARLMETNLCQTPGYGEDAFCAEARERIRELCGRADVDVHFLVGGTQANFTVLAALLRPHQGVLAAETGHIAVHETGAVEATGHKVLTLPAAQGKITAAQVDAYCARHLADEAREHTVMPAAVYLSQPTELGTVYSRAELTAMRAVCDRRGLALYVDGARLGYAMAAMPEVDLPFLAEVADAFYIGGTKQGALFGEAVVLTQSALKRDFRYLIKQRGGMLAKGRLLGIQFTELLRDGLYMELSRRAVGQAMRLKAALTAHGVEFLADSPTNQQFPILPDATLARLAEKYAFAYQCRVAPDRSAVRFCTGWATRDEDVDALIADLFAEPRA